MQSSGLFLFLPLPKSIDHFYFSLQAAMTGFGMAIGPEPMVRDDIKQGLLAAPYGFRTTPVDYVILSLELPVRNKDMKVFIEWISDKLKLPNDAA